MKLAIYNVEFLHDDNGLFVGVNLGWDFTAEHEWGINGIKDKLGIPSEPTNDLLGFDARTVRHLHPSFRYIRSDGVGYLCMTNIYGNQEEELLYLKNKFCKNGNDLQAMWSGTGFAIRSKENDNYLIDLCEAFLNTNAVVFLGAKSDSFSNAGLNICIKSRIPKEAKEQAIKDDLDMLELQRTVDDTGIIERLKSAGRRYFACSPRWHGSTHPDKKSDYKVIFWLNPYEQHLNNYGWFTVEELDQWIDGKGPVPKTITV